MIAQFETMMQQWQKSDIIAYPLLDHQIDLLRHPTRPWVTSAAGKPHDRSRTTARNRRPAWVSHRRRRGPHRCAADAGRRTRLGHPRGYPPQPHPGAAAEEGPAAAIIPRPAFAARSSGGGEERGGGGSKP